MYFADALGGHGCFRFWGDGGWREVGGRGWKVKLLEVTMVGPSCRGAGFAGGEGWSA